MCANETGKRQMVDDWMQRPEVDLLLVQGAKVTRVQTEHRGGEWYFATEVDPGAAAEAAAL